MTRYEVVHRVRLGVACLIPLAACFEPEEESSGTDTDLTNATDMGTTSADWTTTSTSNSAEATTREDPETTDPSTSGEGSTSERTSDANEASSDDPDETAETVATDSGTAPVCGDGEVEGDEVCDDGVNDGSYGGCLADCSAFASHCGDGEVNGPEQCDDRTNEGSYGGCNRDCTLAAHCGDGEVNGPEQCDEGDDNADAMGCNHNCVVSGSILGTYHDEGMVYCRLGVTTSGIEFRANGNALISVNGFCPEDSLLLGEFDPAVTLIRNFADDVLLPEPGLEDTALMGDDWLLSTQHCTYRLTPEGELTEACDAGRIAGSQALEVLDDTRYVATSGNDMALYGPGSPAVGDSPLWAISAPTSPPGSFGLYRTTIGHQGSIIRVGRWTPEGDEVSRGFIARYTSAGNLASSRSNTNVREYQQVQTSPDGGYLVYASTGGSGQVGSGELIKLDTNMDVAWTRTIEAWSASFLRLAVDSQSRPVVVYQDADGTGWTIEKLDSRGQSVVWSNHELRGGSRMAVAPDDAIWITYSYFDIVNQLDIVRIAP